MTEKWGIIIYKLPGVGVFEKKLYKEKTVA